jgi:hypothetical protein
LSPSAPGFYSLIERNTNRRVDTELQQTMEGTAGLLAFEMAERESEIAANKSKSAEGESDIGTSKRNNADEEDEAKGEEIEPMEELLQNVLRDRYLPDQSAAVFDVNGQLLAEQLGRGDASRQLTLPVSAFADQVAMRTQPETQATGDDERRVAFQRVAIPSGEAYLIVVSQSLKPVKEDLKTLRGIFYLAVPVALTLAGWAGRFLLTKALDP